VNGTTNSSSPLFWRSTSISRQTKKGRHPKHPAAIPIAIVFYNNIVSTTEFNIILRKELERITGSSMARRNASSRPSHTRPTVTATETLKQYHGQSLTCIVLHTPLVSGNDGDACLLRWRNGTL
jgi:hypothetical protein